MSAWMNRQIHEPFKNRDDVGSFGVYQGIWNGRRKEAWLREHIAEDVVLQCPANILCAQDVRWEFIGVLRGPARGYQKKPQWIPKADAAAVAARAQALRNATPWHVCHGNEFGDKTCIVAVKASVATEVQLLEWRKIPNGKYKDKNKRWHEPDRWQRSKKSAAQVFLNNASFDDQNRLSHFG